MCLNLDETAGFYLSLTELVVVVFYPWCLGSDRLLLQHIVPTIALTAYTHTHTHIYSLIQWLSHRLWSQYIKGSTPTSLRAATTSAPALFTVMMRNPFIVLDAFWNMPRWFQRGAFVNATAAVAPTWAGVMSFSRKSSICKVIVMDLGCCQLKELSAAAMVTDACSPL